MRQFEGFQHGINLGGWLSQRNSETKEYMDSFVQEKDFETIAGMKLDHVRIPVDYTVLETEEAVPIEEGYQYLDNALTWAKHCGLHVIIDLHKTHGYSFDPLDKGMDREAFFHNPAEQERFYALWERIARRYAAEAQAGIVAFELLNEIVSPNITEEWNRIADAAIARLRTVTPDAWIVVGGVRYNNVTSIPLLHKPADDHIVFNFHCYEPILFTHQKAYWVEGMPSDLDVPYPETIGDYQKLGARYHISDNLAGAMNEVQAALKGKEMFEMLFRPATETAARYNVPLYCGEYGVIDRALLEDTVRWFTDISAVFDQYQIGRALWNYRNKDFGLMDDHYAPIRARIIEKL